MRKLRILAVASASLLMGMSALLVACGDDDGMDPHPDGGGTPDAKPDQSVNDGGSDASDARGDAPTPPQLVDLINDTFCTSLARCCFDDPNIVDGSQVDAGADAGSAYYSAPKCRDLIRPINFAYSATGAVSIDGGPAGEAVSVDEAKAAECLQKLKSLTCDLPGAEFVAARKVCFEAFEGARKQGESCKVAMDCAKGLFCDPAAHECAPLRTEGQPCGIYTTPDAGYDEKLADSFKSEEACSWRGSADTLLRCASYDFDAQEYRPYSEWKCEPTVAVGESCNDTRWCTEGICDSDYICQSPYDFAATACKVIIEKR